MGPANLLFFFVLTTATPFLSTAQTFGYYSMPNRSTVWINKAQARLNNMWNVQPILEGSFEADIGFSFEADFGFSFAAGFVCASTPACDVSLFAVFILGEHRFYADYTYTVKVVWSANRASPVGENATLELTLDGNLALRDADGSHVWSSNSSGQSAAGMVITEIGNLVLFDHMNATVWQSFDHPTDTMVPGQSLLEGMSLTTSTSATNTTEKQFHINVFPDGLNAFYAESTPPQVYFWYETKIRKTGNDPTKATLMNGSLRFTLWQGMNDDITLPITSSIQYMRLDSDGHLRLYELSRTGWNVVSDVLGSMGMDYCAYPTACGEYGLCSKGQCSCSLQNNFSSSYFKPVNEQEPNLGCIPVTPISCYEMQRHKLLTLTDISYYYENNMVVNAIINEDDCKQACLKDCSCKGILFTDGECALVTKVLSLHTRQPEDVGYNSSAYLKVQLSPSVSARNANKKVILAGTLGCLTTLILFVIASILYLKRRRKYEDRDEEFYFDQFPGMPTRFSLAKLSECTEGFNKKLGEGGFGSVFEGKLGEQKVAVKRLEGARQGKKEFLEEVETIGSIEHINLVSLIGFCAEKFERLLVYEYMSRGSLDRWIYYRHNNSPLDWSTRCRIILDIAKGLCYLHEECKRKIVHLDIKPQNILLDDNFNAKVADFGLCKLINRDQSKVVTVMRGTPGYLAPEWLTSHISEKVDVYSFGVVVMEIVSGRKNIDHSQPEEDFQLINLLREKAQNNQLIDLIDKHSDDVVSHQEEVIRMMKLAIWCLQNDNIRRPSMSTVIKVLEGALSVETFDPNSVMYVPDSISTYSVPQASTLSGPR